ncbi:deoxyguanosinetriphosphate triphosphohydrolase family protein [Ruminococcus flavefaciens]|uniref:deoxyguanosinetriphosphate triphosphohydrolase family protein n=1 Tax=Ruminococcus flavefaciens TaxID=1265 RepID=UPI0004661EC9|nr:HD domain-containing protein [Ruminococcus flavefaciens]
MIEGKFKGIASYPGNPNWDKHIERQQELYQRENDIRTEYERDYTRILHSLAYRRLKHKTQVFFNIDNDHICTRMEHVQHVESVSSTIASYLGLNTELTRAIAMGHDLGHAPFGHEGEVELTNIRKQFSLGKFWHEQNGLHMVDDIELLEDNNYCSRNLNLTYAVRDGIISHCGEVDENGIFPREETIDLTDFKSPGQYQAYTWEGCVVKIADKIAYLGRDIEDAIRMKFLSRKELLKLANISKKYNEKVINTTVIMHNFIISICENSSPECGIRLSEQHNKMLKEIKDFNYKYIYLNKRFEVYRNYTALIIRSIFDVLFNAYSKEKTIENLYKLKKTYPTIVGDFLNHINQYIHLEMIRSKDQKRYTRHINNKIYYDIGNEIVYVQAIIDFISGMTDRYAISAFNELIKY